MTKNEQHSSRREAILRAARDVFATKGYAPATVDEIARKAGISKGGIYNYFAGKHDLFAALFREFVTTSAQIEPGLLGSDRPALDKVRTMIGGILHRLAHTRQLSPLLLDHWVAAAREPDGGPLASALIKILSRQRDVLTAIINDGMNKHQIRRIGAPGEVASIIQAAIAGLIVLSIIEHRGGKPGQEAEGLLRSLVSTLSPE